MGCDIHLWAERRNRGKYDPLAYVPGETTDEEPWLRLADPIRECWSCKGTGKIPRHWLDGAELEAALLVGGSRTGDERNGRVEILLKEPKDCSWCDGRGEKDERFYHGRNYGLFSILANVRNSRRVFGSGAMFDPIAEPRGVPRDASDFYVAEQWRWGPDGHSHSWFTVRELLDFPWEHRATSHTGVVTVGDRAWKNWRETGSPWVYPDDATAEERDQYTNVAGDISGEKVSAEIASADEASYLGRPAQIEWAETYEATAADFLKVLRDEIAPLGDPDKHRLVFFFDN